MFVRAAATSTIGVTLGPYLARLDLAGADLGIVIAAGLAGAAVAAIAATLFADRIGRRRFLLAITALSAVGTVAFAFASAPIALAAAGFVGMVNGMGRDRGAQPILETAALPATASDAERTQVVARYTMLQDIGHALGALAAGIPAWVMTTTTVAAQRSVVLSCAGASAVILVLYIGLGDVIERDRAKKLTMTPESRSIVTKISALFTLDSLGSGFLTTAMLSYFFFERFGVGEDVTAVLFFAARAMNALSHLGAAWLAKRIGLVPTMVFTHIPSSLLLVTVAFAPSFTVAAVLFIVREGLVEMDVPTRTSYVLAVVRPEERTLASGVTNLVRLAAWAIAPAFAGLLMTDDTLYVPLVAGATLKIAYDLLLWRAFRHIRPPEER